MKILITTDAYSPMISGVVTSVNSLYKELKSKGHSVKILTLSHSSGERKEGDVYYLRSIGIGVYPDARIKLPLHNKLINEIVKWNPDIVHSQTEFSMMMVSKYISHKLNIPHIHTYHTLYEDYLDYLLGGKLINKNTSGKITRILLNSVDSVIVPSEKTKNKLLSYGVNKPVHIIPTGINLCKFKQEISLEERQKLFKKFNISEEDRIIAYVGRVAKEKNIGEIISFLPKLIKENKNTKFLIVGGGPYLSNLKEIVKEKNIEDNVIFTGMVRSEEVYKYYKLAEVFVTASTSETQGLTYIEALSSGCPVVCRYDPCIDGVIEQGKNGFSYKSEQEFNIYINQILDNKVLQENMKKEAIIKANEYSENIFADKVLDKYARIISENEEVSIAW